MKINGVSFNTVQCGSSIFRPMVYNGVILRDYYLDQHGLPWSGKSGKHLALLTISLSKKYPSVGLYINNKKKTINLHRIVCESFHNFPIPNGITKEEWKRTPKQVKHLLKQSFQVNHIDHDPDNYHPSNLEWVSVRENSRKYQVHRIKNA